MNEVFKYYCIKTLEEEGASIIAFKLVKDGIFQEEGIVELLRAPGYLPNNSGARKIGDNLSDLRAQVAANQRGAILVHQLVRIYHDMFILYASLNVSFMKL
jgi:5-oxoprolinase (ATP-hydrolysing)